MFEHRLILLDGEWMMEWVYVPGFTCLKSAYCTGYGDVALCYMLNTITSSEVYYNVN